MCEDSVNIGFPASWQILRPLYTLENPVTVSSIFTGHAGTEIATIEARDADSGDFGKVTYLLDRMSSQVTDKRDHFNLLWHTLYLYRITPIVYCLFFRENSKSIPKPEYWTCLTNSIEKNRTPTCLSLRHGIITSLDTPVERVEMLSNKLGMYKYVHSYDSKVGPVAQSV